MRKTLLSTLLSLLLFPLAAQDISGMLKNAGVKKSFAKLLSTVSEKPGRFFYKSGNEDYIVSDAVTNTYQYFDNSIYADVEKNGDDLIMVLYKANSGSKKFELCTYYHGNDPAKMRNTRYKRLDGDVYVLADELERLNGRNDFVLYSEEKGLYFHALFYETYKDEKLGGGFYKKSKEEPIASADVKEEARAFETYRDLFREAVGAYELKTKQLVVKNIVSGQDEGIRSPFQQQHLGKVLFGNKVTDQNKFTAGTYKSKFSLDEAVSCAVFLDKGLTKYVDSGKDIITQNLLEDGRSALSIMVTIDHTTSGRTTLYIPNAATPSKTSGVFDLVLRNAATGNNYWLQSLFPETITDREHTVKVDVMPPGDSKTIIASGTYTYIPKKGAKVPNGIPCRPAAREVKNPAILALKPRLKEIATYSMAQFNKKEGRNYSVLGLTMMSDWQTEEDNYGFTNTYIWVALYCKDSKGNPFLFYDKFSSNDRSDMGYFQDLRSHKFNVSICDE